MPPPMNPVGTPYAARLKLSIAEQPTEGVCASDRMEVRLTISVQSIDDAVTPMVPLYGIGFHAVVTAMYDDVTLGLPQTAGWLPVGEEFYPCSKPTLIHGLEDQVHSTVLGIWSLRNIKFKEPGTYHLRVEMILEDQHKRPLWLSPDVVTLDSESIVVGPAPRPSQVPSGLPTVPEEDYTSIGGHSKTKRTAP